MLFRSLYSAALREAMQRDLDLDAHIREGEFGPILAWLRDKVHRHGAVPLGEDLMLEVTGRPLGVDAFMGYLEAKYGATGTP